MLLRHLNFRKLVSPVTLLLAPSPLRALSLSSSSAPPASSCSPPATTNDRVVHVGNLDWYVPKESITEMLLGAVVQNDEADQMNVGSGENVHVTMKELPIKRKPRDEGKFHAGSATVAFPTPGQAKKGMEALQIFSDKRLSMDKKLKLRWAPLFNSFSKRVVPQPEPIVLTPELLELRKQRAERYARRRQRIASETDRVIQFVLEHDTQVQLDRYGCTKNENVLLAPELDWSECPQEADPVRGGGLRLGSARGHRKHAAVEAFLHVLRAALLPGDNENNNTMHPRFVADLGCGAGNLALPLAWWLQKDGYQMLGVDINGLSLERLTDRSKRLGVPIETLQQDLRHLMDDGDHIGNAERAKKKIDEYSSSLLSDCSAVVSLHACGMASDFAIAAAVSNSLPFAVSPCCIGKVKQKAAHSRSSGMPLPPAMEDHDSSLPSYPRSQWLEKILNARQNEKPTRSSLSQALSACSADYELLASAADYGVVANADGEEEDASELLRRQRCKLAKRVVETDRLQWAKEQGGYNVRMVELPRIGPLYPKRELLLGARKGSLAAERISQLPTSAINE